MAGTNHHNYVSVLCRMWIQANRPDVFIAIKEEANSKFPQKLSSKRIDLPASIRDLK
jgi:hypothetical protein